MSASSPSPVPLRRTVLVFGGGDAPTPIDRRRLPDAHVVIAADGGTDHAIACGIGVDLVVGDLDSVSESGLEAAVAAGAIIERHERDKDESDLELALRRALDHQPDQIVVTAVSGGRADHLLTNLLLVASEPLCDVDVDIVSDSDQIHVVRRQRGFPATVGQLITLLPVHGPAVGVTTTGLRYPLDDDDLAPGTSRGLSNVAVDAFVTVTVRHGVLLAVLPAEGLPAGGLPADGLPADGLPADGLQPAEGQPAEGQP